MHGQTHGHIHFWQSCGVHPSDDVGCRACNGRAGHSREIIFCTDGGVSSWEEDRIKALVKAGGGGSRIAPVVKVKCSHYVDGST